MEEALIVFIVFASMTATVIVIGLTIYFAKRLEHKQILAAIEKGTPLSELKPPKPPKPVGLIWIKYLTGGIAYLIIAAGLIWWLGFESDIVWVPLILFAIGVAWVIRGLLYRKYEPSFEPSDKNDLAVNKSS